MSRAALVMVLGGALLFGGCCRELTIEVWPRHYHAADEAADETGRAPDGLTETQAEQLDELWRADDE